MSFISSGSHLCVVCFILEFQVYDSSGQYLSKMDFLAEGKLSLWKTFIPELFSGEMGMSKHSHEGII